MKGRSRPFGMVSARGSSRIRHAVWCLATTSIYSEPVDSLPSLKGFWRGDSVHRVSRRGSSLREYPSILLSTLVKKDRVSLFAAIHPGAFPSSLVVFVVTWRETTTRIVTVGNLTMKAKRLFRDISHRIVIRLLSDRRDLRETAICDSDTRTFIYKNIK